MSQPKSNKVANDSRIAENKKAAAKRLFLCPHCKLLYQLLVQQSEQAIASRGIFRFAGIVLNVNLS